MSVQKPWKASRLLEVAIYLKRFAIFLSSSTQPNFILLRFIKAICGIYSVWFRYLFCIYILGAQWSCSSIKCLRFQLGGLVLVQRLFISVKQTCVLVLVIFIGKHFIEYFWQYPSLRIAVFCKVQATHGFCFRYIVWLYSWYTSK